MSWLGEHRLLDAGVGRAALPVAEAALREARTALRGVLDGADEATDAALNAVLARGAVRRRVRNGVVSDDVDVQEHWLPACAPQCPTSICWRTGRSASIVAPPACVLYFYDTSRNGTRRWCSMDGCGSRAKASRHYSRVRTRGSGTS